MSLCKRYAYVEYISKKKVRITTPFYQKVFEFNFKHSDDDDEKQVAIDLLTLKQHYTKGHFMLSPVSAFYVNFTYDDEEGSYFGECIAQISEKNYDVIDTIEFRNKARKFSSTVWIDD